ncbi:MAG: small multi-drug export protein [Patescibacteria group bacterium]
MENEIITILLGMSPVLELRGAIPLAVGVFGFMPLKAFFLGTLGSLIPIVPILFFLYKFSDFAMKKSYTLNRFLTWLFNRTQLRHQEKFNYHHHAHWRSWMEFFALLVFVAIPIPFTGVWSGALVAFVFGIPIWRAALAIGLGAIIAGLIVLSVVLGFIALPFF